MHSYFSSFKKAQTLDNRYNEISKFLHKTPVLTSNSINSELGSSLYFKCENFQKSGAFKMRGVSNAIFELVKNREIPQGLIAHSSGNHGQALAWAAKKHKIPCIIVMPENASEFKKKAIRAAGAKIHECESNIASRISSVKKIISKLGFTEIHPSNQPSVILGQGSAAWELLKYCKSHNINLDFIGVPIGGGGLAAGSCFSVAIWNKLHGTSTKVFGAEPIGADDAYRSLKSGKIESNENPITLADGLRTELGDVNFPLIQDLIHSIYLVSDLEIINGQIKLIERLKIMIESNCSPPFSAVQKNKNDFKGKKTGIILSGGNIDLKNSKWFIENKKG